MTKKSSQRLLLWSCILIGFFMTPKVISYRLTGNTLYDLESSNLAEFTIEANEWNPSALLDGVTKTYDCNGTLILGGYGILDASLPTPVLLKKPKEDMTERNFPNRILQSEMYFERYYDSLPEHDFIKIKFKLYPLDIWNGEMFRVSLDYNDAGGFRLYSDSAQQNICGDPLMEDADPIDIEIQYVHSDPALNFRISSSVYGTSHDTSLGIRDLVIEFITSEDYVLNYLCGRASYQIEEYCTCESNEFMQPAGSGNCLPCHPSCGSCEASGSSSCTGCPPKYYLENQQCHLCAEGCYDCDDLNNCYQCANGYFSVYEDSLSCYPTCDPPLYTSIPSVKRLLQDTVNCNTPCWMDENEYVYLDESCSFECLPPLEPTIVSSFNLCVPPCYPNYVNYDTSCVESCDSPFRSNTLGDTKYCNLPCDSGFSYSEELGECTENCTDPYIIDATGPYEKCVLPNITRPSTPKTLESGGLLLAPLEPNTLTVVVLVKTMQYVRYLDIQMPPRLERLAKSRGRNALSVRSGAKMPDTDDANYGRASLPSIFENRSLTPSFLVNYFENLTTIWIALFCGILFIILEKVFKKYDMPFFLALSEKLRSICKWNFFLMVLATNIDDIILYASLEFRTSFVRGRTVLSVFSFLFALFFMGFAMTFLYGIYYLITKMVKASATVVPAKSNVTSNELMEEKWKSCQVFYRGFNTKRPINQYFYFIYTVRIIFPMLILAIAYTIPMFISTVQVLVSISILAYLIIMRPFQKKINLIQLVLFEFITLIMNFCVMILAGMDANENQNAKVSENLGDVIIVGNDIINIMVLIFFVIKVGLESLNVYKSQSKGSLTNLMKVPLYVHLLIALFLQNSHMGFEEMVSSSNSSQVVSLTQSKTIATQFQKKNLDQTEDRSITSIHKLVTHDLDDKTSRNNTSRFDISATRKNDSPLETFSELNSPSKPHRSHPSTMDLSPPHTYELGKRFKTHQSKNQVINLQEFSNE